MQSDKQLGTWMTKEWKKKRPIALSELLFLQNSLQLMRKKYKTLDYHDRYLMEQHAKIIKQRIKNQTTQYKIFEKQGLDDFGKTVVDCLF